MSLLPTGPEQGDEPNPTPDPEDTITAVYVIDGGWLVVFSSGIIITTDDTGDFEDYPDEPIPLPAPMPLNLGSPTARAIGGEIDGSPVGVVVLGV